MDTKDTETIVEETTEKVKATPKKKAAPKVEDVIIEPEAVEVEVEEEFEDENLHLAYYDNHAITALILSILALITPFLAFGLGGIIGLVLGIVALYQVKQSEKLFQNSMTQTAKILSVIGIVISVIALGLLIIFGVSAFGHFGYFHSPSQMFYGPNQMTYFHRF